MRKLNKIITTAAMVAAILAGTAPRNAAGVLFTLSRGGTLCRARGVRFSTLPGSALCVGLELSEL